MLAYPPPLPRLRAVEVNRIFDGVKRSAIWPHVWEARIAETALDF